MFQRDFGHHLCDLFQRTCPAGKRNERIAQLDHLRLPFGHVLCDDQLREAIVLKFPFDKERRLYAGHLSARSQYTVRQCAHQAASGPAVDQRIPALPDPSPKLLHSRFQFWGVSFVCSKINCNVHRVSFVCALLSKKGAILFWQGWLLQTCGMIE